MVAIHYLDTGINVVCLAHGTADTWVCMTVYFTSIEMNISCKIITWTLEDGAHC